MVSDTAKLGDFLREVSNWDWEEFARAEKNPKYTTNQSLIFTLVRACAMQKMAAIRLALNRIDGKLKTPIKIEMPQIYYLFPNATLDSDRPHVTGEVGKIEGIEIVQETNALTGEVIEPKEDPEPEKNDLPSLSLRQTLSKMSDYPRELPQVIVDRALQTEQAIRHQAEMPTDIPKVKSVVAAHLLMLAQSRDIDALTEVFDQIDGKLVETFQVLGPDGDKVYITNFSSHAPPDAYLNEDGVVEAVAESAQSMWAERLGRERM